MRDSDMQPSQARRHTGAFVDGRVSLRAPGRRRRRRGRRAKKEDKPGGELKIRKLRDIDTVRHRINRGHGRYELETDLGGGGGEGGGGLKWRIVKRREIVSFQIMDQQMPNSRDKGYGDRRSMRVELTLAAAAEKAAAG